MDQTKKKTIKKVIAWVCIAVMVLVLAVMPLLSRQGKEDDGPKASILSTTVEKGSVNSELVGGGTLAEEDAVTVTLPSEVKLKEYLVSNGDSVSKGDPIATVDRVTVMLAIAEVQETLDHLAEEIEKESQEDTDGEVVALAGGRIKILYAKKGADVQDIMLEHGALAVLSLDGLMAVDITAESDLAAGSTVKVVFADGSSAKGKVESNLTGKMIITVEDDDYEVGESVQITDNDGAELGKGELYIYSPWNATAYAGVIDSIDVKEGEKVDAGDTLMELTDAGYTATYRQLVNQRQEYEDLMLELLAMYQTETITAPCDGVVSGIDTDSTQLLAVSEQYDEVALVSNENNVVSTVPSTMNVSNMAQRDTVYGKNVQSITAQSGMTQGGGILVQNGMSQSGATAQSGMNQGGTAGQSGMTQGGTNQGGTTGQSGMTQGGTTGQNGTNQGGTTGQNGMTQGGTNQGGTTGQSGFPQGGMTEQEFELYSLEVVEIASVTPQDTVTMDISINELDINALKIGMSAEVQINALSGEKFEATITDISNTGTNNGGYSYFTVELTMERNENMLVGMNATATMVIATASEVLTVPADALVEDGTKTLIYTGYDEENDVLINPVTVTVGTSDGQTVEIIDGLSAGATCYYAYYDTLEISFTPDFGGGGFGGFSFGQ